MNNDAPVAPNDGMTIGTQVTEAQAVEGQAAEAGTVPGDTSAKAQAFIDALHVLEGSEGEVSALVDLFAEDATLANAALELAASKLQGREQISRFWADYKASLGEAGSKFHHVTTNQNVAGLFWTTESAGHDGKPVHYHGATLLEFNEAGLIQFFRGYYDTRELTI
jgi:hypothetical protein